MSGQTPTTTERWRSIHLALDCSGCKFCNLLMLGKGRCCTPRFTIFITSEGRCDARERKHEARKTEGRVYAIGQQ